MDGDFHESAGKQAVGCEKKTHLPILLNISVVVDSTDTPHHMYLNCIHHGDGQHWQALLECGNTGMHTLFVIWSHGQFPKVGKISWLTIIKERGTQTCPFPTILCSIPLFEVLFLLPSCLSASAPDWMCLWKRTSNNGMASVRWRRCWLGSSFSAPPPPKGTPRSYITILPLVHITKAFWVSSKWQPLEVEWTVFISFH